MMQNNGPLKGIRVVDFTHQAAGPWCTLLLGDMGAEVWKVEKQGRGDSIRYAGGADPVVGSFNFWGFNRNKKSIGIDVKHPDGVRLAKELVLNADVVVENFRPGVMDRLRLGYQELKRVNERVIYCSITAFGSVGPLAQDPAMDLIVQATSGLMGLTGFPDGPPVKSAGADADIASGIYAAYGIALALFHRATTGKGQRIDLTMLDSVMSMLADINTVHLNTGRRFERFGDGHPDCVPYQAFRAQDGYFVVACLVNAFCKRLMKALGREDVLENPRFTTNAARCKPENRGEFVAILQEIFLTNTCEHWIALCRANDVPSCRVNGLEEVFAMEQVKAIGSVQEVPLPEGGTYKATDVITHMSETPGSIRLRPPRLAEHTAEVLRAIGKSEEEIRALMDSGACG